MTTDDHVQHTWNLTHPNTDTITIDLWTDGYTVRVDGGDQETSEAGRKAVEELLEKYTTAGYRIASSYPVNDPEPRDDEASAAEPDGKPDKCPECGDPVEYVPNHCADWREGPAWLCTGCRWGEWIVA
jgi:hypothetical protein